MKDKNNNEMISLILSAYNLSMTKSDQKLLTLLSVFERNGLNLYRFQVRGQEGKGVLLLEDREERLGKRRLGMGGNGRN